MEELKITTAAPTAENIQTLLARFDAYLAQLFPPEAKYGLAVDELKSPNIRFVFVEQGEAVIGLGALRLDQDFAEIKRMYVVPERRHSGVGQEILTHLEGAAASAGRPRVRLETSVAQPEAIALYERAGYARTEPFPPYDPDPRSVFMEKSIAPLVESLGRAGSFP
jgi:putative acetyltransferase